MKKSLTLLIITKIQMKTWDITTHSLEWLKFLKIRKPDKTKHWQRFGAAETFTCCWWPTKCYSHFGKNNITVSFLYN